MSCENITCLLGSYPIYLPFFSLSVSVQCKRDELTVSSSDLKVVFCPTGYDRIQAVCHPCMLFKCGSCLYVREKGKKKKHTNHISTNHKSTCIDYSVNVGV